MPSAITIASSAMCDGMRPGSQVRTRFACGGRWIRTFGPSPGSESQSRHRIDLMGPSFAEPIIRIRLSLPASLRYPPTLCDAAWRITPADVGRSRSSSCSTGHRRDVDRGGGCAKLRLFIKDDSAQGGRASAEQLGFVPKLQHQSIQLPIIPLRPLRSHGGAGHHDRTA